MLKIGPIPTGYVARIEGRGTMHESPGFLSFISTVLQSEPSSSVVLDLEECEYLDSTFLGCVVALHKQFARQHPPRFVVSARDETRRRLLSPTRIDLILVLLEADCESPDDWLEIPRQALEQRDFGLHVLECHRRLADLGGPEATAFRRVAEELARDLSRDESS